MSPMTGSPTPLALSALLLASLAVDEARAQPAPIARAVVPVAAAPEAMREMLAALDPGDRTLRVEGARWLQLRFSEFRLGDGGRLTIRSADDEQTFTQEQLEDWQGLSAIFNGSEVTIVLTPGASAEIEVAVAEVIVGLPGVSLETGAEAATSPLLELFAEELERFLPDDVPRRLPPGAEDAAVPEAICGATDDRTAASHPAAGRIMPIGCTGWIIQDGRLLTAGHCIDSRTQTVEFNVPPSRLDGSTVSPPVRDQYRVLASSIVAVDTGVGNDWAVFQVLPNTQTGLTPLAAQGTAFTVSNAASPTTVRITGFGVDGPAPGFGRTPPRNADNQTQQTHGGSLTQNTGGANRGTLLYTVDTQGGNSGSPVIVDGTDTTIGIHTSGGCTTGGGANAGTSFRNQALWAALQAVVVALVDTSPRTLKRGDTTEVVATVTQGGAPQPGVAVSFTSANVARATVAPATATTDAMGKATATVTGQATSRSAVEISAEAASAVGRVRVKVPDLSPPGIGLLLLALLLLGTGRFHRRGADE